MQIAPREGGFCEIAVGVIEGVNGKFRLDKLGLDGVLTEVVELPEEFRAVAPEAARHVCCVKRDLGGHGFGMFFGPEFIIDDPAVITLYWPETQELECFHCTVCAAEIADWIKEKQDEWSAVFSRSYDGPDDEGPKRTFQ